MTDFQNDAERIKARHQELLEVAVQTRRWRMARDSRNGAWPLALASALERASAAIRARYPSPHNRPAVNAAHAWRTS